MKLTLSLTLAGLLAGSAWAGAAPAAGPASPAVGPVAPSAGPAAPSAGPAAPAAVPKTIGQVPVSPVQAVEPSATAMNTLETGYNLFNLLAAPGMYDAVATFAGQAAEAQAPQAQPPDTKKPSQPQARQGSLNQSLGQTQEKKSAPSPSKAAVDAGSPAAGRK